MIFHNGGPNIRRDKVVLFAFDDYSIPFKHGVRLQLISKSGRPNIVVGPGGPGAADSKLVFYYGTVKWVGDELWMWYLGRGDLDDHQRVCFAKSKDGYHWEKPNLGLVEYGGNTNNNLVDLMGGKHNVLACVVFYDPEESETKRKFKMAFESGKYRNRLAVAFSEDGLTWQAFPNNPVAPGFEMAGGTKFNGCYYLSGQGGSYYPSSRKLVTHVSYDFEHWTQSTCLGFRRDNVPPRPMEYYSDAGEQVHLGAGLWNRGNVIIGFYGQWHGHPSNDRKLTSMDLGLVVSNNALHYREPIPDFRIISAAEDDWAPIPVYTTAVHYPALQQGQGFENVQDETLFWYGPWGTREREGIRVASWNRDRLGYVETFVPATEEPHFISAPIDLEGKPVRIYMNVDGVSDFSKISVEILDTEFRAIPGYSGDRCMAPTESGLRQPVRWQDRETVKKEGGSIRVRVNFGGIRLEDLKVYTIYVE